MVALASEVAKVNHSAIVTAEALDTCLGGKRATGAESTDALDGEKGSKKLKKSSSSSAQLSKEEQLLAEINKIVAQKLKSFDPEKDSDVKKVKSALMKTSSSSKADDLDDDFEMVESGMQEVDTKCPYSQQVFKQPMKRFALHTIQYTLEHTHTCIYTYIHTYIHTYINTYKHTYKHSFIQINIFVHACIHTYIHTYIHT